jgi:hypothetical protein
MDVAQGGVKHGKTYVMWLNACAYLLSSIVVDLLNE